MSIGLLKHYCLASLSADFPVLQSADRLIGWDSLEDVEGYYDSGTQRFTPPETGLYVAFLVLKWQNLATAGHLRRGVIQLRDVSVPITIDIGKDERPTRFRTARPFQQSIPGKHLITSTSDYVTTSCRQNELASTNLIGGSHFLIGRVRD